MTTKNTCGLILQLEGVADLGPKLTSDWSGLGRFRRPNPQGRSPVNYRGRLPRRGTREVYHLTFDSETMFYLKVDGLGWHVQIPCDMVASPSGLYSHAITKGRPVPLPEPRAIPPYTLDANHEWVLDRESRKICWIPPGNVRRGSGGHFWAGLSLVMVGGDGVVRKLSFKESDC